MNSRVRSLQAAVAAASRPTHTSVTSLSSAVGVAPTLLRASTTPPARSPRSSPSSCSSRTVYGTRCFTASSSYRVQDPDKIKQPPPKLRPEDFGRLVGVRELRQVLHLQFEKNPRKKDISVAKLWFRDACQCEQCVSPSSGQKRFVTTEIKNVPQMESCRILKDGSLQIVWANDPLSGGKLHRSNYPLRMLHELVTGTVSFMRRRPMRTFWDTKAVEAAMAEPAGTPTSLRVPYEEWMEGGAAFANGFLQLLRWGLVFVDGVPAEDDAVEKIASRVGHLLSTPYGLTWDVVSKPDPENIAYTSEALCLHQDLLYHSPIPKIQLLHCIENSCRGGESLFSDGMRAAWHVYLDQYNYYRVLGTKEVGYQYLRNGHFLTRREPTIRQEHVLPHTPRSVNWSPPFQSPFGGRTDMPDAQAVSGLVDWYHAARYFRARLEDPRGVLRVRLAPGTCVLVDNRRVMHGREAFDPPSGTRRLRGCYLSSDSVQSTFLRLAAEGLVPDEGAEEERKAEAHGGAERDAREREEEEMRGRNWYRREREAMEKLIAARFPNKIRWRDRRMPAPAPGAPGAGNDAADRAEAEKAAAEEAMAGEVEAAGAEEAAAAEAGESEAAGTEEVGVEKAEAAAEAEEAEKPEAAEAEKAEESGAAGDEGADAAGGVKTEAGEAGNETAEAEEAGAGEAAEVGAKKVEAEDAGDGEAEKAEPEKAKKAGPVGAEKAE